MFDVNEWLKLQDEGIKACTDKHYPQAELTFAKCLKMVKETIAEKKAESEMTAIDKDLLERLAYSLNNLAVAYQQQGKYSLALSQYIESTEIYRKLRGERSLDFATSLHNMAIIYSAKQDFEQAEALFKRSLEIKEQLLASTHPELAALKENMAQMLRKAGKTIEAEKVLRKA